ncbi:MAG: hypothetical protein UHM19_08165 [Bacteroidales bacterium]|nr:hypothetical protein [Bacteroidales bacterium]
MKVNKIIISLLALLLFGACEVELDFQDEIFKYVRVNTDVSNSEIMSIVTDNGDTITYYGDKNKDGTSLNIKTIEQSTNNGIKSFIDFDEDGRLISIINNNGVNIDFEWQSSTTAVIKAHSQIDNYFISTLVDFTNNNQKNLKVESIEKKVIKRTKPLSIEIIKENEYNYLKSNDIYDPNDFPEYQEIDLWITKCESNYNTKNYLILRNANTGDMIGKLVNYEKIHEGLYSYKLPLSSYPTSALPQDVCNSIDNALRNIEICLSGVLVDSTPIIVALNSVACATGIGMLPVAITDAIIFGFNALNCQISIFNHFGGMSELVRRIDSDFYYKEYIISDIEIISVALDQGNTITDSDNIKPSYGNWLLHLEIPGNPLIKSFVLNPANPGQGVGYTATVKYNCIPENSTITLSIVGTDGYSNSITKDVSGNGSAVLNVPGAESGVYDVCTATINMPFGETITMQASLVFGS